MQEIKVCSLTLSPARILKEAITWSAVSVSAVSRDMKSMKAWNVTTPKRLGSTMLIMRANSASPCRTKESRKPGHLGSSARKVGRNCSAAHLTARKAKPNRKHFSVGFLVFFFFNRDTLFQLAVMYKCFPLVCPLEYNILSCVLGQHPALGQCSCQRTISHRLQGKTQISL